MEGKELLTAAEAAAYLNVSKATILKWARNKKIERVKISAKVVLFTAGAIDNFLKDMTDEVESKTRDHTHAARMASDPKPRKKGGGKNNSGESWRDLRQEVSSWE